MFSIFRALHNHFYARVKLPRANNQSESLQIKDKIYAAYETLAESYNDLIDHKPHNAYYDRPNTLALLPDLVGKSILDVACGPGKYAEILIEQGASVTGFDISPSMVRLANERNSGKGQFFVHDMSEPALMLQDETFDIVLCALALQYVEGWTIPVREFYRLLKPRGILVVSIQHPFSEFNFYKSKKYFIVEAVKCVWKGFGRPVEVNSYRRSLGESLSPFTENGFYLDKLVEPRPVKEFEQLDPRHFRELNEFPTFLCLRFVKKEI
jgi:ubiquinone/menaquinone biosynthesis C-methylase UbiE